MWCESHVWEDDLGGETAIICIMVAHCLVCKKFLCGTNSDMHVWIKLSGFAHAAWWSFYNDPLFFQSLTKWCSKKPCRNDKNKCQGHCYWKNIHSHPYSPNNPQERASHSLECHVLHHWHHWSTPWHAWSTWRPLKHSFFVKKNDNWKTTKTDTVFKDGYMDWLTFKTIFLINAFLH